MKTKQLTKDDFLSQIANYEVSPTEWKFLGVRPVIIDFYADWCGPCKVLSPVLEELAVEFDGRADIYKVDTEREVELSAAFGIRSIPSLLFVPLSGKPQMAHGALPKMALREVIDDMIAGKMDK